MNGCNKDRKEGWMDELMEDKRGEDEWIEERKKDWMEMTERKIILGFDLVPSCQRSPL